MAGSLTAAARELARCKLDLVFAREVRGDKAGTMRAEDYNFFCGNVNKNHQVGSEFLVHHRIVSTVKRGEYVSDRMSYILSLREVAGVILLFYVHASIEEKSNYKKDCFYEELEQVLDHFYKYHMKILLGNFNAKMGEDIFKTTTGNESLHQDSNDNDVRIIYLAT
jgi:hypothetical protein